ncbi:MAG: ATP-dependent DNA ligase [Candidatus Micrarchaeaceae archaeon]
MLFEEMARDFDRLESTSSRLSMVDILTGTLKSAKKGEIDKIVYMIQGMLAPPFKGIEIGMAEKFAEEAIALTTGYTKEDVVASFRKTGDLGSTAEQFVSKSKAKPLGKRRLEVGEVFDTFYRIATISGAGSQDAKIKMLAELLSHSTPLEARYMVRFVMGTLRLGVGDATVLEALSKLATGERGFKEKLENAYNLCSDLGKVADVLLEKGTKAIENFDVMLFNPIRPALAERMATPEEILKKMGGVCAVESKYDGLRAQIHMRKRDGKVEIFSRRLERITPMLPEVASAALSEVDAKEAILDGEAISYNEITDEFRPFQETIQRKRKHGIEDMSKEMPLHVFAFDLLYYNGSSYLNRPYSERRKKLEEIVANRGTIRLADKIETDSPKEFERYFEDVVGKGLEGIVAKDLKSRYIAGARKFSWIKMKRSYRGALTDTVDLTIVGYYLGKGSRAEFRFGGLLCAAYNDKRDIFETITKIGTGFSEAQMEEFRKMLEKITTKSKPARVDSKISPDFWVEPRYVVTVKADEITRSPMHTCGMEAREGEAPTGYALRFPRIIGTVRLDKSPEDSTTTKEIIEMFNNQKKERIEEAK